MEEEMRFHLETQIEQNLDTGMAPEEARYAAQRQFGNQIWLREVSLEMWSLNSFVIGWFPRSSNHARGHYWLDGFKFNLLR
jgi:hypothetical protein